MLHRLPILEGYAKVQVDHVESGYETYDLPVPTDEHFNLQDTIGGFIQWPKMAISILKPSIRPFPTPDLRDLGPSSSKHSTSRMSAQRTHRDASPSSRPSPTYPPENQELDLARYSTRIVSRPTFIQDYYSRWMSRSHPELSISHDIRAETFSTPAPLPVNVTAMEVMALLTKQELEMTILALFALALHDNVSADLVPNRCVFLNPFSINGLICEYNPILVENHLREVLSRPDIDNYLLPYHQGGHWSLFILRPNELTRYILDSIRKEKTKDNYRLPNIVERNFGGFCWNFYKPNNKNQIENVVIM